MTQSCDGSLGICVSSFGNIHHQKIALHFNIITIVQSLNILSSTHKMTDFEERIISLWSDSGVAKISTIKSCQREKDRNTAAGEKNSSWQYLPFRCSQSKNKTFNAVHGFHTIHFLILKSWVCYLIRQAGRTSRNLCQNYWPLSSLLFMGTISEE